MGERDNHIATVEDLNPEEELLPHHHGKEATSMEMDPRVTLRPGRVPEQELLVPRSFLEMAAEIGNAPGKIVSIFRVSAIEEIYRPRGVPRGGPSHPGSQGV